MAPGRVCASDCAGKDAQGEARVDDVGRQPFGRSTIVIDLNVSQRRPGGTRCAPKGNPWPGSVQRTSFL